MTYKTFTPEELNPRQRHLYLLGMINPRPVCFASTLNKEGKPNLAPYSFFNIFSSTPPLVIFSVSTRRDGTMKDTLKNAYANGEVVINMVNYDMVRQMAICGIDYEEEINEFEKSGLTPLPSQLVKPFRVKESLVQFECRVEEIKPMGTHAGAANLIFARIFLIHAADNIFTPEDTIDPAKIDMIGRLGGTNYCRIDAQSVFQINQPQNIKAIGFDSLPLSIKTSDILTGNQLAKLAGVAELPSPDKVEKYKNSAAFKTFIQQISSLPSYKTEQIHFLTGKLIDNNQIETAWLLILAST